MLLDTFRMLCNSREEFSKRRIHLPGLSGPALDSLRRGDISVSSLLCLIVGGGGNELWELVLFPPERWRTSMWNITSL